MIRFSPVYFTADLDVCQRFLGVLGLLAAVTHRGGGWAELDAPSAQLCLHAGVGDDGWLPGQAALSFECDDEPSVIADRLRTAGFLDVQILDENFGRVLRVTGPDGQPVQINFSDRTLYT